MKPVYSNTSRWEIFWFMGKYTYQKKKKKKKIAYQIPICNEIVG